jgi:hypothetical protein
MSIHSHSPSLFLSRACPSGQAFDVETIEAISRAYQAACHTLGLADRNDAVNEIVAEHVIELAQTGLRNPTALYTLTVKEFKDEVQ